MKGGIMSIEAVRQFMKQADTMARLHEKLQAIPKGGGQWTIAEVVRLAAGAGFEFTAKDYEDAVNEILIETHAAGALSDSQLALISTGLMCISSDTTNCLCCPNPKPKSGGGHPVTKG
jgi:predicted ribosomally synthesized peptide with nif11-like leader